MLARAIVARRRRKSSARLSQSVNWPPSTMRTEPVTKDASSEASRRIGSSNVRSIHLQAFFTMDCILKKSSARECILHAPPRSQPSAAHERPHVLDDRQGDQRTHNQKRRRPFATLHGAANRENTSWIWTSRTVRNALASQSSLQWLRCSPSEASTSSISTASPRTPVWRRTLLRPHQPAKA